MKKNWLISYDRKADVVYITLGKPVKAVSEEIDEDVLARYHPATRSLVGITIMNFSRRFGKRPQEVMVPVYGK